MIRLKRSKAREQCESDSVRVIVARGGQTMGLLEWGGGGEGVKPIFLNKKLFLKSWKIF